MKHKHYSEAEIALLSNKHLTARELAGILGRPMSAVRQKRTQMGIKVRDIETTIDTTKLPKNSSYEDTLVKEYAKIPKTKESPSNSFKLVINGVSIELESGKSITIENNTVKIS